MASTGSTEAEMMIEYLKDVSSMLALISTRKTYLHLHAEQVLLPQLFAFGHFSYARYLTYQPVTMANLQQTKATAWKELKENGFGGSITGASFSTVHGHFLTEFTVNRVQSQGQSYERRLQYVTQKRRCFHRNKSSGGKSGTALKDRFK